MHLKTPFLTGKVTGKNALIKLSLFWLSLLSFAAAQKIPTDIPREVIAPLIDPAKVATLKGDRPANARLYKVLYWLEKARRDGAVVGDVIDKAQAHLQIEKTKGAAAGLAAVVAKVENDCLK